MRNPQWARLNSEPNPLHHRKATLDNHPKQGKPSDLISSVCQIDVPVIVLFSKLSREHDRKLVLPIPHQLGGGGRILRPVFTSGS